MLVEAGVPNTHVGEILPNRPEIRLSSTCAYWLPVVSKYAASNPAGKTLEKRDRVPYFIDEGVRVVGPAEDFPFLKETFVCFCSGGNNPVVCILFHKEEISADFIRGLRNASFQDRTCGYVKLKCGRSSLSERFHKREASSAMEFVSPEMWVTVDTKR